MKVAVTGHRPHHLGGHSPELQTALETFATTLLAIDKPKTLFTGMALGWDQACAEAAHRIGIPYIAIIPFDDYDSLWPWPARQRFEKLIRRAQEVRVVTPGPFAEWKMAARNKHLVDSADRVFALWNGEPNGTGKTVNYARHTNREIVNVWPQWEWFRDNGFKA